MTTISNQSNCTNAEWMGRAHCGKCHIRKLMLFSGLAETAFDDTLQPINHFLHPPGSVIYDVTTHHKFIYSIRRGMVKLVHISQDGTKRIVRLLGPGAAIGLELLDGADSYHHAAVAMSQVDLCKIPIAAVKQLENKHPELCDKVRDQLQNQLDLADQWIIALGAGTAKQRVAQLLLFMNKSFADKEGAFVLISREDMAAIIGIALETVSRMIAEFKRQKIIYKTAHSLYMCNVDALQQIAKQA